MDYNQQIITLTQEELNRELDLLAQAEADCAKQAEKVTGFYDAFSDFMSTALKKLTEAPQL